MKKLAVLFIFLFTVISLYSFDWPVKHVIITSTFGETRGDHFHTGIDLGGGAQAVYPISDGEVVFRHEAGLYSSIPVGLGNFVVLQHKGNIRSLYCHLKDNSIKNGTQILQKQELGIIGDTGHSFGKHLHLSIIDFETHSILNPLTLLPQVADNQAPVIKNVFLKIGNKIEKVSHVKNIKPSRVEIFVEAYDLREDVSFIWKLAPYLIILYENGAELGRITFDSFIEHSGKLVLNGTDKSFNDIYESEWTYKLGSIELLEGENHFVVAAKDFAGNETAKDYFVNIGKTK